MGMLSSNSKKACHVSSTQRNTQLVITPCAMADVLSVSEFSTAAHPLPRPLKADQP